MPARLIVVARKARKVREKSKEREKRSGGEDGKEYDSFAVRLYRQLRRGSGSLGRERRDENLKSNGSADVGRALRIRLIRSGLTEGDGARAATSHSLSLTYWSLYTRIQYN